MTEIEIIEETANTYSSSNRSMKSNGKCYYTHPDNGNHCAVGRCMLEDTLTSLSKIDNEESVAYLLESLGCKLDDILKPEYRGHSLEFWTALQDLHDGMQNFDDNGITPNGLSLVDRLKHRYA